MNKESEYRLEGDYEIAHYTQKFDGVVEPLDILVIIKGGHDMCVLYKYEELKEVVVRHWNVNYCFTAKSISLVQMVIKHFDEKVAQIPLGKKQLVTEQSKSRFKKNIIGHYQGSAT